MLPSELFRERFVTCFIDDAAGVKNRHDVGIDTITWECDYPHSDSTWPESPELLRRDARRRARRRDRRRSPTRTRCASSSYDPFAHIPKAEATVGALRARATGVDIVAAVVAAR